MAFSSLRILSRLVLPSLLLTAVAASCGGKADLVGDTTPDAGAGQDSGAQDDGAAANDANTSPDAIVSGDSDVSDAWVPPTDGAQPDALLPEAAACLLFHEICDLADDQCCAPMLCVDGNNGPSCRAPQDAGVTCGGNHADCSDPAVVCCPGLDCVDTPMGSRCAYPPPDAGTLDGASCLPPFADCSDPSLQCCPGLYCAQSPNGMRCRSQQTDGGFPGPDAAPPPQDGGTCLGTWADCANATDQCCAGLACQQAGGGMRCRPVQTDGGQCVQQWQPCTDPNAVCCAGLSCQQTGPTMLCR